MSGYAYQFIIASTATFVVGLFALVIIVMVAYRLLRLAGVVPIRVNDKTTFDAQYGQKLLSALVEHDIFIPAACGGKGACGQCKVKIVRGASAISGVECAHIGRKHAAMGERLACVQTVKRPLEIHVPERLLNTHRKHFRVVHNRIVSCFLAEIELAPVDGAPLPFTAGDYVLVEAPPGTVAFEEFALPQPYRTEWEHLHLMALSVAWQQTQVRAYSIANAPFESENIRLLVRIALPPQQTQDVVPPGIVSSYLFSLSTEDEVLLAGPYGDFHINNTTREMVFIGGGAGMAPLRAMIREQLLHQKVISPISYGYGARDQRQLCYQQEFELLAQQYPQFSFHCALSEPMTNPVWQGNKGFIHRVAYEHYLKQHANIAGIDFYLCGPPIMSAAVTTMLRELGVSDKHIFVDDFGG